MKNLLPIITIGFLILSGIGATAQVSEQNQINEFSIPGENQQSFDFTHTILGEYGTATWCGYCRYAHGALKNIYADGQYPFYYVSLVTDKNSEAMQRASQLGITGIPAVHFDGSYRQNVGAGSVPSAQTAYENSINACGARAVDDIDINVAVNWLGDTSMEITVSITNNEGSTYNGHLRTYITEKISSMGWADTGGSLYTFPLLHFAFNEGVSISSGGTWQETITWDGSSMGYNSITEDNILVIASVFDNTDGYVDETAAAEPGQGGTSDPPETPDVPNGPSEAVAGIDVSFSAVTTDPNGDNILYQFDWGNGVYSGWYGSESSGVAIEGSYTWIESGTYEVRVRAKDDNGSSESAWSAPATISILEGPSLDIAEIQGGLLKVSTTIDNPGESEAFDVNWNIAISGGFLLLDGGNSGTFASIPAGGSQEISSKPIIGFGKTKIMVTCEIADGPSDQRQQGATVLLLLIKINPGGGI